MLWIIAAILILVNECTGGEKWHRRAVRNFAVFAAIAAAAMHDPGTSLVLLIIALSAFIGWELYKEDCKSSRIQSGTDNND